MSRRDIDKADRCARQARSHLVIAQAAANCKNALPGRRQQGRADARDAKRRHGKANRRAGKLICREGMNACVKDRCIDRWHGGRRES